MKLKGGLSIEGTPEIHTYFAGRECEPTAVLSVVRMELADGSELSSFRDLERYALNNMNLRGMKLEDVSEIDGLSARKLKISGLDAIEIVYLPQEISVSGPTPAVRGLTVLGGTYLLAVVMMNLDGGGASTPLEWSNVVSSLKIDPPMSTPMKVAFGAGLALALLVLLLFLKRTSHERAHGGRPGFSSVSGAGGSIEGWGNVREAMDPVMPGLDASSAPGRGQPRVLRSSPMARPEAVGARPGAARTLPKSPPRTLPSSPARALPSSPAGGVATPTPPGAARTLPASPARAAVGASPSAAPSPNGQPAPAPGALPRVPTGGPSMPPGAPPVMPSAMPRVPTGGPSLPPSGPGQKPLDAPPPASAPAPQPARKGGLRSTLPSAGRWAESA